ncbi:MAG: hypothetical protein FWD06_09145 [Oscillospiraceae bacterium]|nr:hypothetical protein [Oscillospiraceae bacterium]
MFKRNIAYYIKKNLAGDMQKNALAFVAFLRANDMQFERGGGYWADKLYFVINHVGKSVCYILIEQDNWTIWSDDSGEDSFAGASLGEHRNEIVWDNVNVCESTSRCFDGCQRKRRTIFGKSFDNVCGTAIKFTNPDAETVACMQEIFAIRKTDILHRG